MSFSMFPIINHEQFSVPKFKCFKDFCKAFYGSPGICSEFFLLSFAISEPSQCVKTFLDNARGRKSGLKHILFQSSI